MMTINNLMTLFNLNSKIDLKFWNKNGEVTVANGVTPTYFDFYKNIVNIHFDESQLARTVRVYNIFECNGKEVVL